MIPDDGLPSVDNIGPYLVVVFKSPCRELWIKNFLLSRLISAIDFSDLCDVFPEALTEGRLICELFDLLRYLIPEMVSE